MVDGGYRSRMTRLMLIPALFLVACSSPSYADTPPAQCLMSAGYEDTGNGRTFLAGDQRVTLVELDGVVQPLASEDDVAAYVAAGCR